MESRASASIELVNLLLEYAAAQGFDARELLDAAGLDAQLIADREARIPFEQYQTLWVAAARQSSDPNFGLHFGEAARHFPPGHLLAAMMMNSPTVGEALRRFFRYHGLMSDAIAPRLESAGEQSCIVVEQTSPVLVFERHYIEANLCVILTFLRKLSEIRVRPLEVRFKHAQPFDADEHGRIFGCPLRFEQSTNQVLLGSEVLSRPLRHADAELLETVERMAGERLERSTTPPGWAHVAGRSILRTLLDGGKPAIEEVAHDLSVSVRHLQGQLKADGTTYQQVLDGVRRELALDYLERADVSLCEIAFLLGYADQSAFNHAFKRWTGSTPREHRKR